MLHEGGTICELLHVHEWLYGEHPPLLASIGSQKSSLTTVIMTARVLRARGHEGMPRNHSTIIIHAPRGWDYLELLHVHEWLYGEHPPLLASIGSQKSSLTTTIFMTLSKSTRHGHYDFQRQNTL